MNPIITYANLKGGVGKTTLSVNTAQELVFAKRDPTVGHQAVTKASRVLLVDADPSEGVLCYFKRRDDAGLPFDVTTCPKVELYADLPPVVEAGGYDFTVIDCPAGGSAITRSALVIADLIIVPVQPSLADFDFADKLMPVLKEVAKMKDLHVAVVINAFEAGNNSFSKEARDVAKKFFTDEGINVTVFESQIPRNIDVKKAYAEGKTLREYKATSKVTTACADLTKEIVKCLIPTPVA